MCCSFGCQSVRRYIPMRSLYKLSLKLPLKNYWGEEFYSNPEGGKDHCHVFSVSALDCVVSVSVNNKRQMCTIQLLQRNVNVMIKTGRSFACSMSDIKLLIKGIPQRCAVCMFPVSELTFHSSSSIPARYEYAMSIIASRMSYWWYAGKQNGLNQCKG